jgi:hypothetical protein
MLLRKGCVSLVLVCAAACHAEPARPVLSSNEWKHVHKALDLLNMTPADPGFQKDVGEPLYALDGVRGLLENPVRLPAEGDRLRAAVSSGKSAELFALAHTWLEAGQASPGTTVQTDCAVAGLPPELTRAVSNFVNDTLVAEALLRQAFGTMDRGEMEYAAAALLDDVLGSGAGGHKGVLVRSGIGAGAVAEAAAASDAMEPEPHAKRLLAVLNAVDYASVLLAGERFVAAVERLGGAAATVDEWPQEPRQFSTPCGAIRIGTPGNDSHEASALLVLDPGGDDVYRGGAGAANGLLGRPLAAIVDLRGDDSYLCEGLLGQGSALFGVGVLSDRSGNDRYTCAYAGNGTAVFGVGWLDDAAGDDLYKGKAVAQGAAFAGLGVLRDRAGKDLYRVGMYGQAFAGVRGVGLLVDDRGNDVYLAGRWQADHERHAAHSLSLSQGFATGMRPFIGGGVAALVDRTGNDTYEADVYGQGVGYWYSLGILVDESGHDGYRLHEYGQGSGIHLSAGLLVEGGGNDVYYGFSLAQGAAHDYAVGLLADHGGDDMYTADHYSQGRALNNSYAVLLDAGGNDGYFARRPAISQGVGDDGKRREYGSISLMVDLGGKDRYTCGGRDGEALIRPDHGVVYDWAGEE